MTMIALNLGSREGNVPHEEAMEIKIKQGAGWVKEKMPNFEISKDLTVIGCYIRRQNSGSVKKFMHNGDQLLSNEALDSGYMDIIKKGSPLLKNVALESCAIDSTVHQPGSFKKILIPEGFDPEQSFVWIDSSKLTATEEVLVIHWIFEGGNDCFTITG